MQLQLELHLQRETGKHIAPVLAAKGWKRDKYNNTFSKGDKEAYFSGEWLIFCFSGCEYNGKYFHRINISRLMGITDLLVENTVQVTVDETTNELSFKGIWENL